MNRGKTLKLWLLWVRDGYLGILNWKRGGGECVRQTTDSIAECFNTPWLGVFRSTGEKCPVVHKYRNKVLQHDTEVSLRTTRKVSWRKTIPGKTEVCFQSVLISCI